MTLNYNPEEKKLKYQVLQSPLDFLEFFYLEVQMFSNLAQSKKKLETFLP